MTDDPRPSPHDAPDLDPGVVRDVVDPSAEAFRHLVAVQAQLRSPTGCPWDREQTHGTLARHLLEETYEVLEAIDAGDLSALREELGDLVLQVVFHSFLAYEEGAFTVSDVLDDLRAKLVRRHPHVFGSVEVEGAEEVLANWEKIKRSEKGTRVMDGIPRDLPALAKAAKASKRAAQVGLDLPDVPSRLDDVADELAELRAELERDDPDAERTEAEVGDVLFAVASLARSLGVDPETALRRSTSTFVARFQRVEASVADEGRDLESLSPSRWAEYWERAKHGRGS